MGAPPALCSGATLCAGSDLSATSALRAGAGLSAADGYPQPAYGPPPPASGITLPPWLMSIVFAVLFLAVGAGAYFGIKHFSGPARPLPARPQRAGEGGRSPAEQSQDQQLQKYVEVVGMRLIEDPNKKAAGALRGGEPLRRRDCGPGRQREFVGAHRQIRRGSRGDVFLQGAIARAVRSQRDERAAQHQAAVYELPDWQNLVAEVQITSPK